MHAVRVILLIMIVGVTTPNSEFVIGANDAKIQLSDTKNPCGISDSDFEFFARVVQAEDCGDENDYENQVAIAQVIWNRVDSPNFPDSVREVLTESGQFSTVKNGKCNAVADDNCRLAIIDAYLLRPHPSNMVYFRTNFFFKGHKQYKHISDNYFSLE